MRVRAIAVLFSLFLLFSVASALSQAPDYSACEQVVTNESQLAGVFGCDLACLPVGPLDFPTWLSDPQFLWTDFSALPNEFNAALSQSQEQVQGVTVLKLRLTRWILTGETLVELPGSTNSLRLAAPAGYQASQAGWPTRSALFEWQQWVNWGELDPQSQPTLRLGIALADVQDKPAYDAAVAAADAAEEEAEAEAAAARSSAPSAAFAVRGGMILMDISSGGCVITNESDPFQIVTVSQSGSDVQIVFESCSDHVYQIQTKAEMTNLTWDTVATLVGNDYSTSWTATSALANDHQFWRVERASRQADSDGDFWMDGAELDAGYDPTDPNSYPDYSFSIDGGADVVTNAQLQLGFLGLIADFVILSESISMSNSVTNAFVSPLTYTLLNTNDGVHTVFVQLLNSSGAISPVFGNLVELDTHPPTISITSPTNGVVTGRRRLNIQGFAADAATNAPALETNRWLQVTVNGDFANDRDTNGNWWAGPQDLVAGTNTFVAVATDRAGFMVSNSVWFVYDPTLATNVPTFTLDVTNTVVVGATTTTMALSGAIDDENATVEIDILDAVDNTITNASVSAAVHGTNWWTTIPVVAGTNLVSVTAQTSGSLPATNSFMMIQDPNVFLEITDPPADAVLGASAVTVTGIASLSLSNATITINGQAAAISVGDSSISFSSANSVPVDADGTIIDVQATGNGGGGGGGGGGGSGGGAGGPWRDRRREWGYEILGFQARRWQLSTGSGLCCQSGTGIAPDAWVDQYTALAAGTSNTWTETDSEHFTDNPCSSCNGDYTWSDSGTWWGTPDDSLEVFNHTGGFGWGQYSYGGHTSVRQKTPTCSPYGCRVDVAACTGGGCVDWEEDFITSQQLSGAITFIKRWPTDEEQTVILHFTWLRNMSDLFRDPSQLTFWGQPGFFYDEENMEIGFLVKIKTNTRYTISENDFTYPSYSWSDATGWGYDHTIQFLDFGNQPAPMEVISGKYSGGLLEGQNDWKAVWNKLDLGAGNVRAKNEAAFVAAGAQVKDYVIGSIANKVSTGVWYSAAINGNFFYSGNDCSRIVGFVGKGTAPWNCGNPDKGLSNAGVRSGFGITTNQPTHVIEPDVDENGGYYPGHTIKQMQFGLNNVGALILNGVDQPEDTNWPWHGLPRCRSLLVWSKDQKHMFMIVIGYPEGNNGVSWNGTIKFIKTAFKDAVSKKLAGFDVSDAIMLDGGTSSQLSFRRVIGHGKDADEVFDDSVVDENEVSGNRTVPTLVHSYAKIPQN